MPIIETRGAGSSQGLNQFSKDVYVEDVFNTYVYTGTQLAATTITNGINFAGAGGLVWIKDRTTGATNNKLIDTIRGTTAELSSDLSTVQSPNSYGVLSFLNNGFSLGPDSAYNLFFDNYVAWSFRRQAKFFDIVTYTGTGSARSINHNLGATPGCIFVKRINSTGSWYVYHKSQSNSTYLLLNSTLGSGISDSTVWNSTTATSTQFTVGTHVDVNASGGTYVAYIFASDAGGFGKSGTDSVVSCGTFTTDSNGGTANIGWEPQFVIIKSATGSTKWTIYDSMRGWCSSANGNGTKELNANTSGAESTTLPRSWPTATGFQYNDGSSGTTFFYIAIRRGPMRVPIKGSSVFVPILSTGTTRYNPVVTNFTVDTQWLGLSGFDIGIYDRTRYMIPIIGGSSSQISLLRPAQYLGEEIPTGAVADGFTTTGFNDPTGYFNSPSSFFYNFQKAPGFYDNVLYTGTGANTTQAHNLRIPPELIIVVQLSYAPSGIGWAVGLTVLGYSNVLYLNLTNASAADSTIWNSTAPTASVFSIGTGADTNGSGRNYIAYLFATCPRVSKVGRYTGTGSSRIIDCGFISGARLVLIKRTDGVTDWYLYDTARGMTSSTSIVLLLNTGGVTTGTDYVETSPTGFTITSTAPAAINANGGSYIFLAIS